MPEQQLVTSFKENIQINPKDIEAELRKVWQGAAEADQQKERSSGTRAKVTLSNIILLIREDLNSNPPPIVNDLITKLCISHPSRFFVIQYNEEEKVLLKTAVSSRCVLARSGAHICSEEVYLTVNAEGALSVPNLLMSLLVPEVPVLFLSFLDFGEEFENKKERKAIGIDILELFTRIVQFSERVCYDSSLFSNYLKSISFVSRSIPIYNGEKSPWANLILSGNGRDLCWQRVRRWRYLIAEQFDSSLCGDPLKDIVEIKMETFLAEETLSLGNIPGEVVLLLAWIIEKLSWRIEETKFTLAAKEWEIIFRNREDKVVKAKITTLEQKEYLNTYSGSLVNVNFVIRDLKNLLHEIIIARSFSSGFVEIQTKILEYTLETKAVCDFSVRRVPFPMQTIEELVLAEIASGARSRNFGPAYKNAFEIIEKIKSSLA